MISVARSFVLTYGEWTIGGWLALADCRAQRQRRLSFLEAARCRYQTLSDLVKGALVDELEELSGYHRKSRWQLLQKQSADHGGTHPGWRESRYTGRWWMPSAIWTRRIEPAGDTLGGK